MPSGKTVTIAGELTPQVPIGVVQIVLWIALMYMVINLIVDMSYTALDPRLRKAGH